MGFFSDFIERIESTNAAWEKRLAVRDTSLLPLLSNHIKEGGVFTKVASLMRASKIIRLDAEQAQVFLDTPPVPGQDYLKWLRLPFPAIYIQIDKGQFRFKNYAGEYDHGKDGLLFGGSTESAFNTHFRSSLSEEDKAQPNVRGILLCEGDGFDLKNLGSNTLLETTGANFEEDGFRLVIGDGQVIESKDLARVIQIAFLMPLSDQPLNMHIATLFLKRDGTLVKSGHGLWKTREKMDDWTIHLANFLSSPSIKLMWSPPPEALNKKRQRSGKPALPGWYEIAYRKTIHDYTPGKISEQQFHHSFRYDVRGHFKSFQRGAMAGRVVWCPPHQRGLANEIYKPKTYRTNNTPGVPADLWKG